MPTAEEKVRRVRRLILWGMAGWAVALPMLGCGFVFAQFAGLIPNPASYFNPGIATHNPAPAPFDQAKWDRGHAVDRIAMGKGFAEGGTLNGTKREELVTKLGPFDYESEHEGKTQLTWYLGDLDTGGLFIRHMKLLVKIDHSGTVVDAYTYSTD